MKNKDRTPPNAELVAAKEKSLARTFAAFNEAFAKGEVKVIKKESSPRSALRVQSGDVETTTSDLKQR